MVEPEKKEAKKKKAGAKAKHTCPNCEANAWGKPTLKLKCGDCDVTMVCEEAANYDEASED